MKNKSRNNIKYRAAGIAKRQQRVLIHRSEQNSYWSLPGGRVEFMEKTADTLRREIHEETGLVAEIGRMVWVVENFFEKHGELVHELGFYFLMNIPEAPNELFLGNERIHKLIYKWQDLDLLEDIVIYPGFLKKGLLSIPDNLTHIIIGSNSAEKDSEN